jgi:hypothetical protein
MINHSYFHKIDTEQKAYWLGFILGDGCLYESKYHNSKYIQIGLNIRDQKHLQKFADSIGWERPLRYNRSNNSITLCICSKEMFNDLLDLGVTPRKSITAKFPGVLKRLEIHVLRGLFDADGCISHYDGGKQPSFKLTGSINCLLACKRILKLTNKITKLGPIGKVSRGGMNVVRIIYKQLYKNATIFLERKKQKFDAFYGAVPC